MAMSVYSYTIDSEDTIVAVCDGWNVFAHSNGADTSIMNPAILGSTLWEFIGNDEVQYLYRELVVRVRENNAFANIPIRCDSPQMKRYLNIKIASMYDGFVQFDSSILRVEQREAVFFCPDDLSENDEFLKCCSYCKKIETDVDNWEELEDAVGVLGLFERKALPKITHGICPACYVTVLSSIEALDKGQYAQR